MGKKRRIQLSKNFYLDEFNCKCGCGENNISMSFVAALQDFRDYIKQPLIISSGCRCKWKNTNVGGSIKSFHIATPDTPACACDLFSPSISTMNLIKLLEEYDNHNVFTGRGVYPFNFFIHLDTGHQQLTRWIRDGLFKYHNTDANYDIKD